MVDQQRLREVKSATIHNFGALWEANFEANRARISRSHAVTALFDRFEGVPALVIGAGPSLDKNLPWLHAAAEGRAIVIAVDTIFAGLIKEGIDPTLVITLDPQPDVARFFAGAPTERRILVAPSITHPSVLDAWKGDVVFYNKFAPDIPQLARIAQVNPDSGCLVPGGSVLTVGLDLAFRMGANPIGFAGQDLSYAPGSPAYSSQTMYSGKDYGEMFADRMDEMVTDSDIFGREVMTQKSLFITKQWMEWAFATWKRKNPADFYNLTEGGIVSKGCRIAALSEWTIRFLNEKRNIGWMMKKALGRARR